MKANICGIYKIENELGEVYVGSANEKSGIAKRWSNHLSKLRQGKHKYHQLQNSWNQNVNNLKWEILEECCGNISKEELASREKWWIDYCNKIDGWTVINKQQNKITRRTQVSDITNMSLAQRGNNNPNARLTEEDVIKIKAILRNGSTYEQVADLFGVSESHIRNIDNGLKWKHVKVF